MGMWFASMVVECATGVIEKIMLSKTVGVFKVHVQKCTSGLNGLMKPSGSRVKF